MLYGKDVESFKLHCCCFQPDDNRDERLLAAEVPYFSREAPVLTAPNDLNLNSLIAHSCEAAGNTYDGRSFTRGFRG